MRVALVFIMVAVIAVALALLLGARALRRRAIGKAEDVAIWEESEYRGDEDGMRTVAIRRVATLHGHSWDVEPEKIVARIPRCRDQSTRVTDAMGDAWLLAQDKNSRT